MAPKSLEQRACSPRASLRQGGARSEWTGGGAGDLLAPPSLWSLLLEPQLQEWQLVLLVLFFDLAVTQTLQPSQPAQRCCPRQPCPLRIRIAAGSSLQPKLKVGACWGNVGTRPGGYGEGWRECQAIRSVHQRQALYLAQA